MNNHLKSLLNKAADELEDIRCIHKIDNTKLFPFPPACLKLLNCIQGNQYCVDCGESNPRWASVSYGTLLCVKCCSNHRSLSVKVSFVKSIQMDHWSFNEIISMLEGGNNQLKMFFARHKLTVNSSLLLPATKKMEDVVIKRYQTKAALFYRENLSRHAEFVVSLGRYKGREVVRRKVSYQKIRISPDSMVR